MLLSLLPLLASTHAWAASPLLEVSPSKCVTLKQGNNCYQDIEVQWQTEQPGNYCLTLSTQEKPLQCWTNKNQGDFEFEFVGSNTAMLSLLEQDSGKLVEQSNIEVKWVYRNRSRNLSWRLF